jgi:hypothetical protein
MNRTRFPTVTLLQVIYNILVSYFFHTIRLKVKIPNFFKIELKK